MIKKHWISLGALIAVIALLGTGYFFEYVKQLQPCPLCLLQRYAYYAIGFFALLASLPFWRNFLARFGGLGILIFGLTGGALASRQVWLQHLPPTEVPPCGPSMQILLQEYHIPLWQVLKRAAAGTGDCAKVDWTFLSLSIAEWSLLCFIGFVLAGLYLLLAKKS